VSLPRRVALDPQLPKGLQKDIDFALKFILREHAKQIDHLSHYEVTRVSSGAIVAHDLVLVSCGATTAVVNLVPALRWQDKTIRIKKIDSGAGPVVIVPNGSELVDGSSSKTISLQYHCLQLVSDGSNWHIV